MGNSSPGRTPTIGPTPIGCDGNAGITGIYGNPEVWPLFGYEGPSADKGGYIDRGFDDIDWL